MRSDNLLRAYRKAVWYLENDGSYNWNGACHCNMGIIALRGADISREEINKTLMHVNRTSRSTFAVTGWSWCAERVPRDGEGRLIYPMFHTLEKQYGIDAKKIREIEYMSDKTVLKRAKISYKLRTLLRLFPLFRLFIKGHYQIRENFLAYLRASIEVVDERNKARGDVRTLKAKAKEARLQAKIERRDRKRSLDDCIRSIEIKFDQPAKSINPVGYPMDDNGNPVNLCNDPYALQGKGVTFIGNRLLEDVGDEDQLKWLEKNLISAIKFNEQIEQFEKCARYQTKLENVQDRLANIAIKKLLE